MLTLGKLGAQAGVKVPTIRYYEQIGILPEAERSAGNQRLYSRNILERLAFVRHTRDLGFTLEAIRDLLSLSDKPDQSCAAADIIAKAQLAEVESRLARQTALKVELERMIVQCAGGRIGDCRVIEVRHAMRWSLTSLRRNCVGRPSGCGSRWTQLVLSSARYWTSD